MKKKTATGISKRRSVVDCVTLEEHAQQLKEVYDLVGIYEHFVNGTETVMYRTVLTFARVGEGITLTVNKSGSKIMFTTAVSSEEEFIREYGDEIRVCLYWSDCSWEREPKVIYFFSDTIWSS